jgi:glycerophosphoryl diester phosphodiesterase
MVYPVVRVAHRGASIECPENTLLAYRRAIEHGVDALEVDLHLTRDRQLVAIHDSRLDRVTDGRGLVRDYSVDQIKALVVEQGECIPLLAEIFQLVAGSSLRLCLEIKGQNEAESLEIAEAVVRAVGSAGMDSKVILTSFMSSALLRSKALNPGLATMLDPSPQDGSLTPRQVCEQVLLAGANCLSFDFRYVDRALAGEARLSGLALWPWNPDEPVDIRKMLDLGVPGIMTDRPDVLNEVLNSKNG